MRCTFCFTDGDVPALTLEHLLSKPISEAFGIDRMSLFGRAGNRDDQVSISALGSLAVRAVCARCNNGWMSALETRMAAVAVWVGEPARGLTADDEHAIRAWLLKTYTILTMIEGGVRKAAKGGDLDFVPNFTRARQLYQGDPTAFTGLSLGLATVSEDGRFGYVFGNPTVRPVGSRYANCRSVGCAVITIGRLQLWIVDPLLSGARVMLPRGVVRLRQGLSLRRLKAMPVTPELTDIVVQNPEHDIVELVEQLVAGAASREESDDH